jgi:hypothetical protein
VAYEEIDARGLMTLPYKLINLTHVLDGTIPTWNGGCGFNHDVHINYSDCEGEDKLRVMKIKMHAGIRTHMDALSHCIAGGKCIHDFDLNDLIMPTPVLLDEIDSCLKNSVYQSKVFIFDTLGFIEHTDAHKISYEDALIFEQIHVDVYKQFVFNIMMLPKALTIIQRCEFILESLM